MRRQSNPSIHRRATALRPHALSWAVCLLLAPAFAHAQSTEAPGAV